MTSKLIPPRYGVDAVTLDYDELSVPYCPHGPTIMFERFYSDQTSRQFYACAVHRDKKYCPFFYWAEEITEEKKARLKAEFETKRPRLNRLELSKRLEVVKKNDPRARRYCHTCEMLLLESDHLSEHVGHNVKEGILDEELNSPTSFLTPMDNKKSQAQLEGRTVLSMYGNLAPSPVTSDPSMDIVAYMSHILFIQYYFSASSVGFLVSELKRLSCCRVLCVGAPRLHEALLHKGDTTSMLLDIDHRYAQFYSEEHYQCANMFNGFFFEKEGSHFCQRFLKSSDEGGSLTALVIDPPFGGLAAVLAHGLKKLWTMGGKELPTLLVFPYFMEAHVTSALPSFMMLDYQVTYDNHRHFTAHPQKHGRAKPSPIRIFTNLPSPGLVLPTEEGYSFCSICSRYVSLYNKHCSKCNVCPSKDGRAYVHCDLCSQCVKPGLVHCLMCGTCNPPTPPHTCGQTATKVGCHICGKMDHKRRDCPNKGTSSLTTKKRRSLTTAKAAGKKKAKR